MKITALLFDLDDTLLPSRAIYREVLGQLGMSQDSGDYAEARQRVKARLPSLHVAARNRLLYFKAMKEGESFLNAGEVLRMMDGYESRLAAAVKKHFPQETAALLRELSRSYKIGVVTNENLRTQLIKLAQLEGAGEWLHAMVCSEEVGAEKPEEKTFLALAERLGVSPGSCVMIGDSWRVDLEPAARLGMKVVLSQAHGNEESVPADIPCIRALRELPALLKEWNA
jgi:HAD superfamily hydrolase (TIGR01549 family)